MAKFKVEYDCGDDDGEVLVEAKDVTDAWNKFEREHPEHWMILEVTPV